MKKLSGIFLLACLSLPVLGTYTWLHYQKLRVKQEVKQAMMAGMSKERLVRLAFTQGQSDTLLRWEHAREFEFQNQMYDVLEKKKQGDSIVYWCWWDQEETLLNRHLETLAKNAFAQSPERQKAQDQLLHFFKTLYCCEQIALNVYLSDQIIEPAQIHQGEQANWYHSWKQRPPSPPPKMV